MQRNRVLRTLRRKVRVGRVGLPYWAIGLAAMAIAAVAGQALGPVLAGSATGSGGATVAQTLVLSSAPSVKDADDAASALIDEGEVFTTTILTQAGQRQALNVRFANNSARRISANLAIDAPGNYDMELADCASATEAQLGRDNLWLLTVGADVGGASYDSVDIDTAAAGATKVDIAAVDTCLVYVAYFDDAANTIFVAKSTDGGQTWGDAVTVDATITGSDAWVSIAAPDDDTVYVAYYASTAGAADNIELRKSTDGGATFGAAVVVDTDVESGGDQPKVDVAAPSTSVVYVAYYDAADADGDISIKVSIDGGAVFGAELDVDTAVAVVAHVAVATAPGDTETAYVAFYDDTDDDITLSRVTRSGTTLTNAATVDVDTDVGASAVTDVAAPSSTIVYVVYHDNAAGVTNIKVAKSTDSGATFAAAVTVDDSAGVDSIVAIAAPNTTTVYVAYFLDGDNDILSSKSTNGGTSYSSPVTIDSDAGDTGWAAVSAVDASNVFAAYFDATDNDVTGAESAAGVELTIESKDDLAPGYYTINGRLVQVAR